MLQPSREQRFRPVFTGVTAIYDPDDDVDRRRSGEERLAVVDRFRRRTDQCYEEQTLRSALDEQRHAEADARYQKRLEEYGRDLQIWRDSGSLFKPRGWRKPKNPKNPEPVPPTQEQVEKFRQNLIGKMTSFPRAWIEQRYDPRERARPLRPDEESPDRSSVIAHDAPRRRRQPARDDNGPSRP